MALRDQPYFPLYVQDFMTDEKLAECSASATGVFIRLMCVFHKSEQYGTITLRPKDKQTPDTTANFAFKLVKQMPYPAQEINSALEELISEGVLMLDGDILYQKRMVKDGEISLKRSEAGRTGGKNKSSDDLP